MTVACHAPQPEGQRGFSVDMNTEEPPTVDSLQRKVDAVLRLMRELGAAVVNVGHGRDSLSATRAERFAQAWRRSGGIVGSVVSWPETAASWLRQSRRLSTGADAWVVADSPTGWAGIGPRLAAHGLWRPDRTIAFPGLDDPALPRLAGSLATEGLRGVGANGTTTWHYSDGWLRSTTSPAPSHP